MSAIAQVVAVIGVVIASAATRINAVVAGQHFSVPPIVFLFLAAVLALAALVLHLIRVLAREGLRQRPVPVITTVRWERI